MTSRFKSVGFFFFAAVVFFLMAFFEKRISMVQSQVKAQNKRFEQMHMQDEQFANFSSRVESLEKMNAQLEEKMNVIALNFTPNSGPGEELVQDIIRQGLLVRHDLYLVWQRFIAECIRDNKNDRALITINALKTLPRGIKNHLLDKLKVYPSWDNFLIQASQSPLEASVKSSGSPFWSFTQTLGFKVRKKEKVSALSYTDLVPFIKNGEYRTACTIFAKEVDSQPQSQLLNELCFADSHFAFNIQLEDIN